MANARNPKRRGRDTSRDQGGFVALPWSVLDCPAYAALSMHARALQLEVARQYHSDDNGRMLLSRAYMVTRGWKSHDTLMKAKRELLDGGFIFETVMGHRPNKASWYAVTWRALDKIPGYDQGTEQLFERGAYRKKPASIGEVLSPPHGTESPAIGPPHGTGNPAPVPPHGPMEPLFTPPPVPPHGHPLEKPSTVVCPAVGIPDLSAVRLPASRTLFGPGAASRPTGEPACWVCRGPVPFFCNLPWS